MAAGEDPLRLAKSGNGIGVAFGFCGDTYVWDDGEPACAVIVARPDSGCMGVTLADIPAMGDRPAVQCPYVEHTAACAPAGG